MSKPKVILLYQSNPFENLQGGGHVYLKNLYNALIEKNFINCEYWGAFHSDRAGFKNITNSKSFYVFWCKFLLHFVLTRFPGPTVIHCHRLYFGASLKILALLLFKNNIRIVTTLHGETFHNFVTKKKFSMLRALFVRLLIRIERYCIRLVDDLAFVSERNKLFFINRHGQSSLNGKTSSTYSSMISFNLANISLTHCRAQPGTFVLLGRLSAVKNYSAFIKALAKNRDVVISRRWTFDVYGEGEDEILLKNLIHESGLENVVKLKGQLSHKLVNQVLECAQALVLCSKNEAAPTVLLEACYALCPFVSTDVGFASEIIDIDSSFGVLLASDFCDLIPALDKTASMTIEPYTALQLLDARTPRSIADSYIKKLYLFHEE